MQGYGRCIYGYGNSYEGYIVGGERNGYGKYEQIDGQIEQGYYVQGKYEGKQDPEQKEFKSNLKDFADFYNKEE